MNESNNQRNELDSEERIDKTMRQLRHEVGARDMMTFTFGRAWCALLVVASVFVVVVEKWATSAPDPGAPTANGTD